MVYTPDMVLGEQRKGIKVTYCTDTRPVPVIAEEAKGADLFICEGMYGEPEMASKAVEKKHMTFVEAAELARVAEPGQMWLTHFSPSLIRPDFYMEEPRKIFERTYPGKDQEDRRVEVSIKEGSEGYEIFQTINRKKNSSLFLFYVHGSDRRHGGLLSVYEEAAA